MISVIAAVILLNLVIGASPEPYDFIPDYLGEAHAGSTLSWTPVKTQCFLESSATVTISAEGAEVAFKASRPHSLLCADIFLLCTQERMVVKTIVTSGMHTAHLRGWKPLELEDVKAHGVRLFHVDDSLLRIVLDIYETVSLFWGRRMEKDNLKFLKEKAGMEFLPRSTDFTFVDPKDIPSGAVIVIMRLDGLDPMVMYGTGSRVGHTGMWIDEFLCRSLGVCDHRHDPHRIHPAVMTLWMDGELYVVESQAPNPFGDQYWPPPYGVIRTPYKKWIELARKAQYNAVMMRLAPEYQRLFDEKKAIDFFYSMQGQPYGYHSALMSLPLYGVVQPATVRRIYCWLLSAFINGWIDTPDRNLPAPLSGQHINVALYMFDKIIGKQIATVFLDALNMRLKMNHRMADPCPDVHCAVRAAQKLNMTLMDLIIEPEHDEWVYHDGYSMVCSGMRVP